MIIRYLGVELHRLRADDLSEVRKWRNQKETRRFMRYSSQISAKTHAKWFKTTQKVNCFYFVLKVQGQNGGVLQLSDIDYDASVAQVGIFMGNRCFKGSWLPWIGSYVLLRFAFDVLRLRRLQAVVCAQNSHAIAYNKSFGFSALESNENRTIRETFMRYELIVSRLERAISPYLRLLKRLEEGAMQLSFTSAEAQTLHPFIAYRSQLKPRGDGAPNWHSYLQTGSD